MLANRSKTHCHAMYEDVVGELRRNSQSTVQSSRSIAEEVVDILHDWGLAQERLPDAGQIRSAFQQQADRWWMAEIKGKRLRQIKSVCVPSFYVLNERKP